MGCSRLSSPFVRAKETKFRCIGRASASTQMPAILTPILVMVLLAAVFAPATAFSQNSPPPSPTYFSPTAIQVLDLNGKKIPGGGNGTYQQYTVDFTANGSTVTIWFAFRDDPADISFTDVSVTDLTNPSVSVPVQNYTFSSGMGQSPTDWNWSNASGINSAGYGVVASGSADCYTYSSCWFDGSLQGYDTIGQTITDLNTTDVYQLSFYVAEDSQCEEPNETAINPCTFSSTSTNGDTTDSNGNGIDAVTYLDGATLAPTQTLTVALLDSGTGYVMDSSGVINCGEAAGIFPVTGYTTCTASYQTGTSVRLTAFPNEPTGTSPTTTLGDSTVTPAIPGWSGCTVSTKNANVCEVTMDSAQTVTAAFVLPGESGEATLTVGNTTTLVSDNGGGSVPTCTGANPNPATCGSELDVTLTGTWTTPVSATVEPFPNCNTVLQGTTQNDTSYANAYCFDILNGGTVSGGPEVDDPIGFEVTCPPSPSCGSQANPFDANIGPEFYLSLGAPENPELSTGTNGPLTNTLLYNDGNLYPGVIKFDGTYSLEHPCLLDPNATSLPTFSNQISSFTFLDGQPGGKTGTASGGSGSCWFAAYGVPGEVPTASISALALGSPPSGLGSGQEYPQDTTNSSLYASFMCGAVNEGSSSTTGPYLTVASCTLTNTWTGGSASYAATIPTPNAQTAAATGGYATVTDTTAIDTTNTGPHTLTATVVDSATDTITSSTTTYYVGNVTVTVGTNVAGLSFSVDGTPYSSPQTFTWNLGTQHTLATTSPQGSAGTQYSFTNWSDGTIGLTDTVTANASITSYTASFNTSYQLTAAVGATGGGTVSPTSGSYYAAGTVVTVTETTNPGYAFTGWSGACSGAGACTVTMNAAESVTANFVQTFVLTTAASPSTGGSVSPASGNSYNSGTVVTVTETTNPGYAFTGWSGACSGTGACTVTMNAAESVTANFTPTVQITVGTSPTGLSFTVDSTTYTSTQTFTWNQGSSHTISTTSPQAGTAGTQYVWSSWSNSGAISQTVTAPTTATTYTANFTTQYQLTTAVSPAGDGTVAPASGSWYNAGTAAAISATANSGYTFSNWTSSPGTVASSTSASTTITMSAPESVTANFTAAAWTITTTAPCPSFGTLSVGQSAQCIFTITNPGSPSTTTAITVVIPGSPNEGSSESGEVDPDDYVITSNNCPSSLAGGKSCAVTVTWTPDSDDLPLYASGGSDAFLQVLNSAKTVLASVTMTGKALDPTVSLTLPASNPFASVAKGSTVTAATVATLNNTGTTTLILTNLTISGSSTFTLASGTNACAKGGTVAAGSSCTVYVTFKPTSTSAVTGTVTITDNATTGSGKQTISLTGN